LDYKEFFLSLISLRPIINIFADALVIVGLVNVGFTPTFEAVIVVDP
jgi:uncharacterized membrane protein YuzA (DUF378 family)